MGFKLELRNEQKLIMTPMLQQALKILQLPTLELENVLLQELLENPMLEEKEVQEEDSNAKEEVVDREETPEILLDEEGIGSRGFDEEEWARYFSDDDYEIPKFEREANNEYYVPQLAQQPTLEEHLLWQLRLASADKMEHKIGEWIIGNLDERGFFTLSISEVAQTLKAEEAIVADILNMIQGFDPLGVAARDVTESLMIQLKNLPVQNRLAENIVEKHFLDFKRNKIDKIARLEKKKRIEILEAAKVISELNPYPGRNDLSGRIEYIVPDVVVEKHEDEYIIIVNDNFLPTLKISNTYRSFLRRKGKITTEAKKYFEDKLQKAIWLLRGIEQRKKTLYRVVEKIVEIQREFLDKGSKYLKSLTLKEVAEELDIHESTVSRVIARKYVQTPRGIFELKKFFSTQMKTLDGQGVSAVSVRMALQELIEQENPAKPYSDQKLTELLSAKNFDIARRTVAKYREELKIPPASRRKK